VCSSDLGALAREVEHLSAKLMVDPVAGDADGEAVPHASQVFELGRRMGRREAGGGGG
jgi:hypothetical protein